MESAFVLRVFAELGDFEFVFDGLIAKKEIKIKVHGLQRV